MDKNITLGRRGKILHLSVQKRTLLEKAIKTHRDGNPAFTYYGYLFPEVRKYFEEQDYQIKSYDQPEIIVKNEGLPLHIFFPKDEIILNKEELNQSERL